MDTIFSFLGGWCSIRQSEDELRNLQDQDNQTFNYRYEFLHSISLDEETVQVSKQSFNIFLDRTKSTIFKEYIKEEAFKKILKKSKISNSMIDHLLKTQYFTYNEGDGFDSSRNIDLLKVLLFFLMYTKLSKRRKIEIIIELSVIMSNTSKSSSELAFDDPEKTDRYYVYESILLFIVSLMLSSTMLPFIYRWDNFDYDDDFIQFKRYIKSHAEQFYNQGKSVFNLLFESHGKSQALNDQDDEEEILVRVQHLKNSLLDNYQMLFTPGIIRKHIIEAWETHKRIHGLSSESDGTITPGMHDKIYSQSSDQRHSDVQPKKPQNLRDEIKRIQRWYKEESPERESNQVIDTSKDVIGGIDTRPSDKDKSLDACKPKRFNTLREYRISTEVEQKLLLDEEERQSPVSKLDIKRHKTIKSELEEFTASLTSRDYNDEYNPKIESKYGFHLMQYFNVYFGGHSNPGKFDCIPKRWRIKNLLSNYSNYKNTEGSDNLSANDTMEQSLSFIQEITELRNNSKTEQEFLKNYVKTMINYKELCDFYNGAYFGDSRFIFSDISNIQIVTFLNDL